MLATNIPFAGDVVAWINYVKNWFKPATFEGSAASAVRKTYEYGAVCVALKAEESANSCK